MYTMFWIIIIAAWLLSSKLWPAIKKLTKPPKRSNYDKTTL
jgi:hypothetical protein